MAYSLETQGSTSSGSQISSTDSSGGEGSHRCLSVLQGHEGHVFSLALAGGILYSGSDCGEIRSWRQPEFQESVRFGSGEGSVKAMVVVGSKVYSAHQDQKIRVWKRSRSDPGAHKLVATLPTVKDYMMTCITPKNYIQVCVISWPSFPSPSLMNGILDVFVFASHYPPLVVPAKLYLLRQAVHRGPSVILA